MRIFFPFGDRCTSDFAPSIDIVESDEIPASVLELARAKRTELIEQLAEVDEEMGDMIINEEVPTNDHIANAIRRATVGLRFSPVFMGSAIKNTAVQPMLDGVCNYLANPSECDVVAHDTNLPISAPPVSLVPAAAAPFVGLAFKLEEGRFGQLTYIRVYQGTLAKGNLIYNAKTGKKVKVPRLVRMHSNEMEVSISTNLYRTRPWFHLTSGCHCYRSWRDLRHLWSRVLLWWYLYRWFYKFLYGKNHHATVLKYLKVDNADIDACSGACHIVGNQTRRPRKPELCEGAESFQKRGSYIQDPLWQWKQGGEYLFLYDPLVHACSQAIRT